MRRMPFGRRNEVPNLGASAKQGEPNMGAIALLVVAAAAVALDALGIAGLVGRFADVTFLLVPGIFVLSLAYGLPFRRRG